LTGSLVLLDLLQRIAKRTLVGIVVTSFEDWIKNIEFPVVDEASYGDEGVEGIGEVFLEIPTIVLQFVYLIQKSVIKNEVLENIF